MVMETIKRQMRAT